MTTKRKRGKAGPRVPAKDAYARVVMLRDQVGMSLQTISEGTGVSRNVLSGLIDSAGEKNVYQTTADAILSFTPERGVTAPYKGRTDARGSRRRIQALAVIGYSFSEQARRIGMSDTAFREIEMHSSIEEETAEKIRKMYRQLWDKPYTGTTHSERIGRSKAINRAKRRGYKPGAFWEDMDNQKVTHDGY